MNRPLSPIDDIQWERLRCRGAPLRDHVLSDPGDPTSPQLDDRLWQSFKERCAADGDVLPQLIAHLEPQVDPGMFRWRGPRRRKGDQPFSDLPPHLRIEAEAKFKCFCEKWEGDLPSWRRAILIGVARRLTLRPASSEWGKRMRRIKGGVNCQRKYRQQGGHPLMEFTQAMAKRRIVILDATKDEKHVSERPLTPLQEARKRLGLTSEQLRGVGSVAGIVDSIPGRIEGVVEGLRWSREPEALAFLEKFDSIPAADLQWLSIDEICLAAGVDSRHLLGLAVDGMLSFTFMTAKIQIASNHPQVIKVMVKNALTPKGLRDRRMFLEGVGFLPPKGTRRPKPPANDGRTLVSVPASSGGARHKTG